MVEPGAMKKIQEKLADTDLLKRDDVSGKLDEPTRRALRRFQDGKDLPATGVPDDETVRKLGLDPKDVFRASDGAPAAQQPEDGATGGAADKRD